MTERQGAVARESCGGRGPESQFIRYSSNAVFSRQNRWRNEDVDPLFSCIRRR
jgi:hypothetical protein